MAGKKKDEEKKALEKKPIAPDDGVKVIEGGEAYVEEMGEVQVTGGGNYRDGAGRILGGADDMYAYRTIPSDVPADRADAIARRWKGLGYSEMSGIYRDVIDGRHFRTTKKNAENISASKLASATAQRQSQAVPAGMDLGDKGRVEYGEKGK